MATSKITLSSIEINTNDYINAHGKDPKGYGLWFFQIGESKGHITGHYTEATKYARKSAQRQGLTRVDLLS